MSALKGLSRQRNSDEHGFAVHEPTNGWQQTEMVVNKQKVLQNKLDVPQLKFDFSSFPCYHMGFLYAQKTKLDLGLRHVQLVW